MTIIRPITLTVPTTIYRGIQTLGFKAVSAARGLGAITVFALWMARCAVTPPLRSRRVVDELYKQGVLSLVIVVLCGLVVGMVLALQGYNTLARFGAEGSLGAVVGLSLIRELGPVITGLLVTGRAGSATAAELGSMAVTEQFDGLRMLAIDPIHLVVTPKAVAMILAVPLLTAIFIVSGIYGGYIVGVGLMHVDPGTYMASLRDAVTLREDVSGSVLKSLVFGTLLGLIATFRGYTSARTAAGVSEATTSTVVFASVSILLFDYVVTALWGSLTTMERNPVRDFFVGLFVLLGLGALAYLSLSIGGVTLHKTDGLVVYALFDEIGGLKPRAPVMIGGVKVGDVVSAKLTSDFRVKVVMDLDSGLRLPDDSFASIYTEGILGDRYLALEPGGSDTILKNGQQVTHTQSALILEKFIGKLIYGLTGGGNNNSGGSGGATTAPQK